MAQDQQTRGAAADLLPATRTLYTISIMIFFAAIIVAAVLLIPSKPSQPIPDVKTEFEHCKENSAACASVDMDDENAQDAYEQGCNQGQAYSCFKLGQFFETKTENREAALKAYHKSCEGKDSDGCRGEAALAEKK